MGNAQDGGPIVHTRDVVESARLDMQNHVWLNDPDQATRSEMMLAGHIQALLRFIDKERAGRLVIQELCAEAAALYRQGGVFPINGMMASRLERAGVGIVPKPSVDDWQPIETAPRDGTEIDLAYVSERSGKVYRDADCKWGRDADGDLGWLHYERHPEVSYEDEWQLVDYEPFAWRAVTVPVAPEKGDEA